MAIPEERIKSAKEKYIEEPKAKTVEIQTAYRYVNTYNSSLKNKRFYLDMAADVIGITAVTVAK